MKQFGGKVTKELKERYRQSPQWDGSKFLNQEETKMDFSIQDLPKMLYEQFFNTGGREPKQPIPVQPFDWDAFMAPADQAKLIWYGHSVILMSVSGLTILIDPMLGPDASPIAPFRTKRFSENTLEIIEQLPPIDVLLMTHDHYDHLDLASIERLKPKVKQYVTSLGTGRHLAYWGIDAGQITELDWWEQQQVGELQITFTPTRHFSGRGLTDRAKSLWGGWAIKSPHENLYFSGDGGYGPHFVEVGERLGPFDFGMMECGQYNESWHLIHMYPEESIQAAQDAKVAKIMPVHWAGFALAQHTWTEPVIRFTKEAQKKGVSFMTPPLGQLFGYDAQIQGAWWEEFI